MQTQQPPLRHPSNPQPSRRPQQRRYYSLKKPSRLREAILASAILHIWMIWQIAVNLGSLPTPSLSPLRVVLDVGLPIYDATSIVTEETRLPELTRQLEANPQTIDKPQGKPQREAKTTQQPKPKSKPRPEPSVDPLPELIPLLEPEPLLEDTPEPMPLPPPTPEPTPLPPPAPEPKSLPKPEPKPEPLPEVKPEPVPLPPPTPEPTPLPKPEPKPEPLPEVKPEPVPLPPPVLEPKPRPKLEPLPELKPRLDNALPTKPQQPKGDDFFTMLKRKQAQRIAEELSAKRANESAAESERKPSEDEQRTKKILSNLRFGSNGLFQIKRMDPYTATFSFKGWTTDFSSANTQFYEVEAQAGQDIRLVVVKRMISIIREHYDGDFVWESHRLNRNITLSARLADTAQLEDFLMIEFFGPNYKIQDPLQY